MDHTKVDLSLDPRHQRLNGWTNHGGLKIDCPVITKVTENLYMGGCIGGLHLPVEILHVISLYPWERYKLHEGVKSEVYYRAYDAGVEVLAPELDRLAAWAEEAMKSGPTLIHCQAGLNRSGLLTALVLIRAGGKAAEVVRMLREKRSPAVLCNQSFESYLLRL